MLGLVPNSLSCLLRLRKVCDLCNFKLKVVYNNKDCNDCDTLVLSGNKENKWFFDFMVDTSVIYNKRIIILGYATEYFINFLEEKLSLNIFTIKKNSLIETKKNNIGWGKVMFNTHECLNGDFYFSSFTKLKVFDSKKVIASLHDDYNDFPVVINYKKLIICQFNPMLSAQNGENFLLKLLDDKI